MQQDQQLPDPLSSSNMSKTKREKFRSEFRKQSTALLLTQKRNLFCPPSELSIENPQILVDSDKIASLALSLYSAIESKNVPEIYKNLRELRASTCTNNAPPLQGIADTQIIPHIINLVCNRLREYCEIHLECLWLLTNLSCGGTSIIRLLIDNNIIFALKIIVTESDEIRLIDQAIMCSANLASEDEHRDLFFIEEFDVALQKILTSRKDDLTKTLYKNIAFFLSNLSRKNHNYVERLAPFLNIAAQFLHLEDEETIIESTWTLYNMAELVYENMMKIRSLGVISKIIKSLLNPNDKIKWAALRFVSQIARGPDDHTDVLYQNNIYIYISAVLDNKWTCIRKEALYTISNLVAEDKEVCLENFVESDVFHKILKLVMNDEILVVKEGIYVLTNFISSATPQLTRKFVYKGGFKAILGLLDRLFDEKDELINRMLGTCDKILATEGSVEGEFVKEFVQCGGIAILTKGKKELVWENVSEKCIEIYDKYIKDLWFE